MIFCVEDDNSIRDLILYALRGDGFRAEGFPDGSSFRERLREERPELLLLDIMLPGEDGLAILSSLRASHETKDIPVILLTAKNREIDKVRGLDIGADDYVTKPFSILELLARVRAVLRRTTKDSMSAIEWEGLSLDPRTRVFSVDGQEVELTFKEFELMHYFLENRGIVLSRDRIMSAVWGFDYHGESRTVDVHIGFLRGKLGDRARMIQTIRNVGYKLGEYR